MATDIAGATVEVQLDLGETPFILDRDRLDDGILNPIEAAYSDVSCEVISADWTWGAPAANGILTDVVTGRAAIVLSDPARKLDPLNPESPMVASIGSPGRILVDGIPAFTGRVTEVEHDLGEKTSHIDLADRLAELNQQSVTISWAKTDTLSQAQALFTQIGMAPGERVIYGASTSKRLAETFVGTAFEAWTRLRDAELGDFWIDRQGRLAFRARNYPRPSVERAVIGCDGIALETIRSTRRRIGLVNHVVVDMVSPTADRVKEDAVSVAANGRRSFVGKEDALLFDNV